MEHKTSNELYKYWDAVRNNRRAPHRFEIEPSKIANILSQTFILERRQHDIYRFRLAGTQICSNFGKELRGKNILDLWLGPDWTTVHALLDIVTEDAAVGVVRFRAMTQEDREAEFEMIFLPLIHTEPSINRVLGSIAPIETPFWLGTVPLSRFKVLDARDIWANGLVSADTNSDATFPDTSDAQDHRVVEVDQRRFRIYDGGLSGPSKTS